MKRKLTSSILQPDAKIPREYKMEIFGKYEHLEINSIVDHRGNYWFTQQTIAAALELDNTTMTRLRKNHPAEFTEGMEVSSLPINGTRQVVYSEEGFLTICDLANTERAFRLRRWMRKQFRVKQNGGNLTVYTRQLQKDDLSDLGEDLQMLQRMLDTIAENRRRIMLLEESREEIEEQTEELKEQLEEHEARLTAFETQLQLKPGELTAIQLADHCGWRSRSGGPHNTAVILAALNAEFHRKGWMRTIPDEGPGGLVVNVFVFSVEGVSLFKQNVDSLYPPGQSFEIIPNTFAVEAGHKNKRNVFKM